MSQRRRNHYDVTDTVRISHPQEVCAAVSQLLRDLYPDLPLAPVHQAFDTFTRLYAGTLPGYVGCDTWYHDAQHSLDCALAMARLFDGYERSVPAAERLGPRRAALGIIIALFHDAGYIRHTDDEARNGAEYTLIHVRRSGDFLADFLPTVGFGAEARMASRLVHFTGSVSNSAVLALFDEADVFLLLSDFEGLPISLLEAMSAGVCPVVTDVGGSAAVLGPALAHQGISINAFCACKRFSA